MELYLPPADSTTSVFSTLMPVVGMSSNTTVPRWRGTDLVVGAPPSSTHAAVGACQTRTTVPRHLLLATTRLSRRPFHTATSSQQAPPLITSPHTGSARLSVDQEASSSSVASLLFFSTGFFGERLAESHETR